MSRMVEVEAFVAVVAAGSFVGAAERLEVSPSYVSKLVSRLEDRLGVRLLHRSTRRLALTDDGRRFHAECAEAVARVDAAEQLAQAGRATPTGTLRVSLPTAIGQICLSRTLAEFMAAWPTVDVDAFYTDRSVDLIAEGFDVTIRVGHLPDSALIVRRVARVRRRLVASAAYLERNGRPRSVADLRHHRCLRFSLNRAPSVWRLERGDEVASVTVTGPMVANSGTVLADAARCGVGIGFLPDFHTARQRADGGLVEVLPGWGDAVPVQALMPDRRHPPAKVRVFVDAVAAALAEAPWAAAR